MTKTLKFLDGIFAIMIFVALLCIVGNAGAVENDLITMTEAIKKIGIDIALILIGVAGAYITSKIGEEYE